MRRRAAQRRGAGPVRARRRRRHRAGADRGRADADAGRRRDDARPLDPRAARATRPTSGCSRTSSSTSSSGAARCRAASSRDVPRRVRARSPRRPRSLAGVPRHPVRGRGAPAQRPLSPGGPVRAVCYRRALALPRRFLLPCSTRPEEAMSPEIPPPRPGPRGADRRRGAAARPVDRSTRARRRAARGRRDRRLRLVPGRPLRGLRARTARRRAARSARRAPVTTTKPPVLVHVAGAVVHPGLVRVTPGARVADAIEAAGGAVPTADLDRLNLAAKVADGQRILVVDRRRARAVPPTPTARGRRRRDPSTGGRRRAGEPQHRDHRATSTRCPGSARRSRRPSCASASGAVGSRASTSCATSAASARSASPTCTTW